MTASNKNGRPLGYVILEFDDGYIEVYENVFQRYSNRGVVMLITGLVGFRSSDLYVPKHFYDADGARGFSYYPTLFLDQIKEMSSQGWDFEAHTLSHPHLSKMYSATGDLAEDVIMRELLTAKKDIESYVGKEPIALSIPYIDYDQKVKRIIDRCYRYVVSQQPTYTSAYNPLDVFDGKNLRAYPIEEGKNYPNGRIRWNEVDWLLELARKRKVLVIFLIHRITDRWRSWDVSKDDFRLLISKINGAGFNDENIITFSQLHSIMG